MHKIILVLRKEVLDNLRDRRTLLTALLFGPLFGPAMFTLMMQYQIQASVAAADQSIELPVSGAQNAPNLVRFLSENNIKILDGPADPQQAVRARRYVAVLEIPADYATQLRQGLPAVVRLYSDRADQSDSKIVARTYDVLKTYNQKLAALRMQLRGINNLALTPIVIEDRDISTATSRSAVMLSILPYFLIFAMLMGGFYLATDTTAGERERKSLEPLLCLPVSRRQLLLGKFGATTLFSLASFALALMAFGFALPQIPFEKLDMSLNFNAGVILGIFLLGIPLVLFGTALLMLVAAYAKSYKEAQTYLSITIVIPMIPILIAAVTSASPTLSSMLAPALSQHLLMLELIKGEAMPIHYGLLSAAATFGATLPPLAITDLLYRQERLLG